MPFNTYTFLAFFLLVLGGYYSMRNWTGQKLLLLFANYIFYSAWNPVFVLLLLFSTLTDWLLADRVYNSRTGFSRKLFLTASLSVNLGLLGFFKYGNFFLETSQQLLTSIGIHYAPPGMDIILPVGISFYTFQTLSYTLDVYRNKITPEKSFCNYALYVSFFPQLVAGPIVRAAEFLPQLSTPRRASANQMGWGFGLLLIGLFMKVIMADTIFAPVVDRVYDNPSYAGRLDTWTAILSFSGQIFCDFSGYSTAAIGIALCLGFALPVNFNSPYGALGFKDFWKRWHMTLSSWLRDYLYISLGGNRKSFSRTNVNVMLTMLLGGLWHGAAWNFVLWGGIHGMFIVLQNLFEKYFPRKPDSAPISRLWLILLTYLAVSLGWVFFRSESFAHSISIFYNLFADKDTFVLSRYDIQIALTASMGLLGWHVYTRNISLVDIYNRTGLLLRTVVFLIMSLSIYLFGAGDDRAFIYFQF